MYYKLDLKHCLLKKIKYRYLSHIGCVCLVSAIYNHRACPRTPWDGQEKEEKDKTSHYLGEPPCGRCSQPLVE